MFGTEMHLITLVILVFQVLVLFAQCIIYFSRPKDTSRFRFLILVLCYIIYNACSGLFPDTSIQIPMLIQLILDYGCGILVAVYFVCYVYDEYNIKPIQPFNVRSLELTLVISFVLLFIVPYLLYEDLVLSRKLFLPIPVVIAIAYFFQVSKDLLMVYVKNTETGILARYRLISSNLGLFSLASMPIITIIGNYQAIQHIIVNAGFMVMMVTYILDFVAKARNETRILAKLEKKLKDTEIQMADKKLEEILERLRDFEDNKEYLEARITLNDLAQRFQTNSRYLSFVVNKKKGKTFVRYINDLRVAYLIQRLKEDIQFRHYYTLKGMADEAGFTTSDRMGKAFKQSQRVNFSDYLKKVRARK